jgi:hypothetical protein
MLCKFFDRNIVPAALLLCVFQATASMQLLTNGPSSGYDVSGNWEGSPYGGPQRRDGDRDFPNVDSWTSGNNSGRGGNRPQPSQNNRRPNRNNRPSASHSRRRRGNNNGNNGGNTPADWKAKYDTLMATYTNLQEEYNRIKQLNIQLEIKIREYEKNAGQVADLKARIQRLEAIIEDLKDKLAASDKDAARWRAKYEDAVSKLEDYKAQIVKLNAIIVDLKKQIGDNGDIKKQLEDAYKKIAQLQNALDDANAKIKKLTKPNHHGNNGNNGSNTGNTNISAGISYEDDDMKSIFVGAALE